MESFAVARLLALFSLALRDKKVLDPIADVEAGFASYPGMPAQKEAAFGSPVSEAVLSENSAEAQAEAVVEPDGVADDLGRKAVSVVARCLGVHPSSLPVNGST